MATIKEQTEKTEQLKTSLDDKVIAIADEIKKQDNIDITRLSEVPDAISQLKNSRKRWASGTSLPLLQDESRGDIYWEFKNLDFKPSIAMVNFSIYNEASVGSPASVTENLASFFIKIDSDFDIGFTNAYYRNWTLKYGYLKINNKASTESGKNPSHKDNSITIVYRESNVIPKLEYITVKKWIAFE